MKQSVLKLNKSFLPIEVCDWNDAMKVIINGSAYPVNVEYERQDDGTINVKKFEYFEVVRDWKEWMNLPVREVDDSVKTVRGEVRIPPFVVTSSYNAIPYKKTLFPSKSNILERDGYICQYTGKKLTRAEATVDHILPVSRGGQNTWQNLVCCDMKLNIWKGNRTPKECGLKLIRKPVIPPNGKVFNYMRDEWLMFLDNGEFQTT